MGREESERQQQIHTRRANHTHKTQTQKGRNACRDEDEDSETCQVREQGRNNHAWTHLEGRVGEFSSRPSRTSRPCRTRTSRSRLRTCSARDLRPALSSTAPSARSPRSSPRTDRVSTTTATG